MRCIRLLELDQDLGIRLAESRQRPHQQAGDRAGNGTDTDDGVPVHAAKGDELRAPLQRGQCAPDERQELPPDIRHSHAARMPMEQRAFEQSFEICNELRHGRLRESDRRGRPACACELGDRCKSLSGGFWAAGAVVPRSS